MSLINNFHFSSSFNIDNYIYIIVVSDLDSATKMQLPITSINIHKIMDLISRHCPTQVGLHGPLAFCHSYYNDTIYIYVNAHAGFPQKSQKKVPWFFHDFSRPKSKFPDKKISIFVFATHISICRINYRHTQTHTHTHTDTHMIWSKPTDYSTDFTRNWSNSKSQTTIFSISLKWVTNFPINIWKMILISHFHTDFILNTVIIIL